MFGHSGFWTMAPLRYAATFDIFLSLDCAPTPSTLAQSKERKGSNFAIWQPCAQVAMVKESLERDMELLCVTGVEDKLQDNVRNTLELLRNAGVRVWMLTGDKLETATCIAKSSMLVSKTQAVHIFRRVPFWKLFEVCSRFIIFIHS